MSENEAEAVVDWAGLVPEPVLEETPPITDVREAFATPDYRAHGRNKRKLFQRDKDDAKASAPRRTIKQKSTVPNRKGQFVEPLTQIYASIGGLIMIRDPGCGQVVIQQAGACAEAIDDLAYTEEWVRNLCWTITQTGKYGKILAVHAPILFVVLIHHVPAVSEAVSYMSQAFAQSVVREEANSRASENGSRPGNVPGAA